MSVAAPASPDPGNKHCRHILHLATALAATVGQQPRPPRPKFGVGQEPHRRGPWQRQHLPDGDCDHRRHKTVRRSSQGNANLQTLLPPPPRCSCLVMRTQLYKSTAIFGDILSDATAPAANTVAVMPAAKTLPRLSSRVFPIGQYAGLCPMTGASPTAQPSATTTSCGLVGGGASPGTTRS